MDKSIRPRAPKLRVRPAYRRADGALVWACHDLAMGVCAFGDSALDALRMYHRPGLAPHKVLRRAA